MKVKNFNDVLLVITALNYILALRNYADPKNRWRYCLIWLYNVFVSFVFTISMISLMTACAFDRSYNFVRSVCIFFTFICSVTYNGVVILGWYHRKNILTVKKKINMVDEKFKSLGFVLNYHFLFYYGIILSIALPINVVISCIYTIKWMPPSSWISLFTSISYVYGMNIGIGPFCEFAICVSWLKMRFCQLNDFFHKFILEDQRIASETVADDKMTERMESSIHQSPKNKWFFNNEKIFPMSPTVKKYENRFKTKLQAMQNIRLMHLRLCNISKMLNNMFSTQLTLYASTIVMQIVIMSYAIYIHLYKSTDVFFGGNMEKLLVNVLDAVYNFLKIVLACYICELTIAEANKLSENIHTYSVHDFDTEMKDEILQFSLQISYSQISWSRYNLFQLNYGFLRGCISFVTTYLVVMIQWTQSTDSDDPFLFQSNATIL